MNEVVRVEWNEVKEECGFPEEDNNKGYIYGVYFIEHGRSIAGVEWYNKEEERETAYRLYKKDLDI